MKDELGERIMVKFVELEAKTYSYLIDDCNEDKKGNIGEKVCHKKNLVAKIIKTVEKQLNLRITQMI